MLKPLKRLEMKLRSIVPGPLRSAYRFVRTLEPVRVPNPLPAELVQGCSVVSSRVELIKLMPKGGKVAELGTFKGDFARSIIQQAQPAELHLIDIDYSQFNSAGLTGPSVHRHVGLTHEVITSFAGQYFDWVYVDADHSYDGCLKDARAAAPKIRQGGFMLFNDFAHIDPFNGRYGVKRAVMDFANEARWPLAFLALDVYGLYDVALRKPD
jgi:hypothetical protein